MRIAVCGYSTQDVAQAAISNFFSRVTHTHYLAGFDANEFAVTEARRKCPRAEVYQSDLCSPELRCSEFDLFDLIVCCDVLYVPGIRRARSGLEKLVEAMRPGALFLLHLPAYEFLKSEHDRVVHTSERYTQRKFASFWTHWGLRLC